EGAGFHQRVSVPASRAVEHQFSTYFEAAIVLPHVFPDADRLRRVMMPKHQWPRSYGGMSPEAVGKAARHPFITEGVALTPGRGVAAECAGLVRCEPDGYRAGFTLRHWQEPCSDRSARC